MKWILMALSAGFLSSCVSGPATPKQSTAGPADLYVLESEADWGKTLSGETIPLGGFSGLSFKGKTKEGESQFLTLTDRGPNGEPVYISGVGRGARPFLIPDFQPRVLVLETHTPSKTVRIVREIKLTDPLGKPLSGRPQVGDEKPVNLKGELLETDLMGIDPEGVTVDDQGFLWLCEEYRPSLLKFDPSGKLLKRFIPVGSVKSQDLQSLRKKYGQNVVVEALPAAYKFRRANRGFEGLVFHEGKIHALLQSPLEIPGATNRKVIRWLVFDPKSEKP